MNTVYIVIVRDSDHNWLIADYWLFFDYSKAAEFVTSKGNNNPRYDLPCYSFELQIKLVNMSV